MARWLDRFMDEAKWLDALAAPLQSALGDAFRSAGPTGKTVQDLLNGTWLGHPLHPVITDVPVGSLTATAVLDTIGALRGDDSLEDAADITLGLGLAASIASIVTGLTQWNDTYGKDRKLGLAHGLVMLSSTAAYAVSMIERRAGSRGTGIALANFGYLLLAGGAYLGGDEVYHLGYGINRTAYIEGPSDYVQVVAEADLEPNTLTSADAQGTQVLLVKLDNGIFALDDTCTHAGCSLAGGQIDGMSVICPCHGSRFDLRDGAVINGPATSPEPSYFVRVRDGMVEVKQAP